MKRIILLKHIKIKPDTKLKIIVRLLKYLYALKYDNVAIISFDILAINLSA